MKVLEVPRRPDFIHHQRSPILDVMREIVFGAEDGMVSTVGSLTGIAAATSNPFTVILAGFVIVAVESISMGVGAYLSTKSASEVDQRKLAEERLELEKYPEAELQELVEMYIKDGWPADTARHMADVASRNKDLFLKEMAYRELGIDEDRPENAAKAGLFMFISYVIGGAIPMLPYLFLPVGTAIMTSLVVTFMGLFTLGALTTKFTKRSWWKAGLEMLGVASVAAVVGYVIGQAADRYLSLP
ncbi:MAG: VIT1/CCC1 transporter family protein [Patescibacteria group bacterium]